MDPFKTGMIFSDENISRTTVILKTGFGKMTRNTFSLKIGIPFFCFAFLWPALSWAQSSKPVKIVAFYDTAAVPELFNTIPVGFTFVYSNGKRESTRGLLGGKVRWNSFSVQSSQGEVHDGQLVFNLAKVWQSGHKVIFCIKIADTTLVSELELPYVKRIRFNLYTDSLKRNVPFYLNVEGIFSSGRIYPLDTERLEFKASAGVLNNNILLVKKSDTAIHQVKVYARLKTDPALCDSVVIPVKKVGDTAKLPTEQQLLQQWKRQSRNH